VLPPQSPEYICSPQPLWGLGEQGNEG
jgi:hypothetical protein